MLCGPEGEINAIVNEEVRTGRLPALYPDGAKTKGECIENQLAKIKRALEKDGTPWPAEERGKTAYELSCSDLTNGFKTVDIIDLLAIEKELDPAFPLKLLDEMIKYHKERNKNRISIEEKLADYDRMKEELMGEKNKKDTRIGCGFDKIIRCLVKTHPNTPKKGGKE